MSRPKAILSFEEAWGQIDDPKGKVLVRRFTSGIECYTDKAGNLWSDSIDDAYLFPRTATGDDHLLLNGEKLVPWLTAKTMMEENNWHLASRKVSFEEPEKPFHSTRDGYLARYYWNERGEFHRLDGPAIEYHDGDRAWYIDGKQLSEEQFNQITHRHNASLKTAFEEEVQYPKQIKLPVSLRYVNSIVEYVTERQYDIGTLHDKYLQDLIEVHTLDEIKDLSEDDLSQIVRDYIQDDAYENVIVIDSDYGDREYRDSETTDSSFDGVRDLQLPKEFKTWHELFEFLFAKYGEGQRVSSLKFAFEEPEPGYHHMQSFPDCTEYYNEEGLLHRTNGPARVWRDGERSWWVNGRRHRSDGPAIEYSDGLRTWYVNDTEMTEDEFNRWRQQHNASLKLAFEEAEPDYHHKVTDEDGNTFYYDEDGNYHRLYGPATEYSTGAKCWMKHGFCHRLDGPAFEGPDGYKEWWIDGGELSEEEFNRWRQQHNASLKLAFEEVEPPYHRKEVDGEGNTHYYNARGEHHRTDGPAFESPDGYKVWYRDGRFHRTDGPAIEIPNEEKQYWVNGRYLTPQEFENWKQQYEASTRLAFEDPAYRAPLPVDDDIDISFDIEGWADVIQEGRGEWSSSDEFSVPIDVVREGEDEVLDYINQHYEDSHLVFDTDPDNVNTYSPQIKPDGDYDTSISLDSRALEMIERIQAQPEQDEEDES